MEVEVKVSPCRYWTSRHMDPVVEEVEFRLILTELVLAELKMMRCMVTMVR